ncbi:MAG: hypothetical protein Q8Q42_03410 [Nanoarchaeota archaeon]|nr:hypothetical protein [Nanoarchaeota archaeon]
MGEYGFKLSDSVKFALSCGAVGALGCIAFTRMNRVKSDANTTYYNLGENSLENKVTTNNGLLFNLYSSDAANFTSLGLTHDLVGAGIAMVAGMGGVRHKIAALGIAFTVAYFPEMVNVCNEIITGSEVFMQTGKDMAFVAGAYFVGKALRGFKGENPYSAGNFKEDYHYQDRRWWNG